MNSHLSKMRFQAAPWFNKLPKVTIVGAGGIGSWTTTLLSRAGCPDILICDMDRYEAHNIAGQLCLTSAVSMNKAESLSKLAAQLGCTDKISPYPKEYGPMFARDVMVAAVDNMRARKQMFEDWKKRKTRELFVDGRLLAEHFQIFCVKPGQEEEYEKYLFKDEEVDDEACSYKQTSHAAACIGSYITSFIINYTANKVEGVQAYFVPFYYENIMSIGHLNVEKNVSNNSRERRT